MIMWSELFSLLVHSYILAWALYMHFKEKRYEKATTTVRKVIYWVAWSLLVAGNMIFILQDIKNLWII